MANNRKAGEPGRYCKADAALSRQIFARATDAQHATYLALGGADWLRTQLDAEIVRQRSAPTPTANNPFPAQAEAPGESLARAWATAGDKGGPSGY